MNGSPGLQTWRPWATTLATLYFVDGGSFFPVSRRMSTSDDLPRAALQALLAGPNGGSGLTSAIPPGVEIRSFELAAGVAHVDLSAAFLAGDGDGQAAQTALIETMTAVPGVTSVTLSVEGKRLAESAKRVPLLYYASRDGLVAMPTSVTNPRAALTAYLSGSGDAKLTSLPPDVLGLIASLTEFPVVRAVQLDFEGHSRLGLGQCSDLLRTPQPRPALLNDERLLDRAGNSR